MAMVSPASVSPQKKLFFSIVIPAHNEAAIIAKTLSSLKTQDYPKDRYEVLVIENGSTDETTEVAKAALGENMRVYSVTQKGVSHARNFGLSECAPGFDWCLFLDADTIFKEHFLTELNGYLLAHPDAAYGTTRVLLDEKGAAGAFWSWYLNVTDRAIKIMHRVHIVRKDLTTKEKYPEDLDLAEDLAYTRSLSKHGRYFFMDTDQVITSARRFKKKGYLNMFFINMKTGLLPKKILRKTGWEVIR